MSRDRHSLNTIRVIAGMSRFKIINSSEFSARWESAVFADPDWRIATEVQCNAIGEVKVASSDKERERESGAVRSIRNQRFGC